MERNSPMPPAVSEAAVRTPPTPGSPLVSVIVLNYKRRQALERCLKSAADQTYARTEVIVVDNGSGDDIAEYLSTHWPKVRLLALPENRGATGGRNAGIAAARGELLLTLDNDVFFEGPHELERMVESFARHPEAAVLACQLCDEENGEVRIREW